VLQQTWWYTTLLGTTVPLQPPLAGDVDTEVAVVGAGMAGLTAAYRLSELGVKVVLLERNICGGSSSGKSAGFLTPDSELELSQILRRFGPRAAGELWQVPERGIALIRSAVRDHGIACDFHPQDSLFLASDAAGANEVEEEIAARRRLGYPATAYAAQALPEVVGSTAFHGGVRYGGTYGINALQYCQGLKRVLLDRGVRIYEGTEVRSVRDHTLYTHGGTVRAQSLVLCLDKPAAAVTRYARNVFHAQTFLAVSEPLTDAEVAALYPGDLLQCWDTDLVYSYWRLTGDQRLLLGGGSALTTFALHAILSPRVIGRVIARFRRRFPVLDRLRFVQYWPGLIDTTRDLFPTVVRDPDRPWVQAVLGCVGLPWAAFCGDFAARHAVAGDVQDDHRYYRFFRPDRGFLMPLWTERWLGRPIVFSLNNAWAKYWQRDRVPDDEGPAGDGGGGPA